MPQGTRGPNAPSLIERRYEVLIDDMDETALSKEMETAISEGSLPAIRLIWPKLKRKSASRK
jgi:hypothetical protein